MTMGGLNSIRLFTIPLILVGLAVPAHGQLQLPRFDLELKGMQTVFPGQGSQSPEGVEVTELTSYYAALHVQINQFVGVGGFYAHSIRGAVHHSHDLAIPQFVTDAEFLHTGLDVRISTGRSAGWRPCLSLRYGKVELAEEKEGYRVAGKSSAVGASLGLMRRLGSKVYLTVIELGANKLSEKLFWIDTGFSLEARIGVLVNFGKKK